MEWVACTHRPCGGGNPSRTRRPGRSCPCAGPASQTGGRCREARRRTPSSLQANSNRPQAAEDHCALSIVAGSTSAVAVTRRSVRVPAAVCRKQQQHSSIAPPLRLRTVHVQCPPHFHHFVRADVGAVGEAEVHQVVPPKQVTACYGHAR